MCYVPCDTLEEALKLLPLEKKTTGEYERMRQAGSNKLLYCEDKAKLAAITKQVGAIKIQEVLAAAKAVCSPGVATALHGCPLVRLATLEVLTSYASALQEEKAQSKEDSRTGQLGLIGEIPYG